MTESINNFSFCKDNITFCTTLVTGKSCFGTSRFLIIYSNYFLTYVVTNEFFTAFTVTIAVTVCINMIKSAYRLCVCMALIVLTGKCLNALFCTCGLDCYYTYIVMTGCSSFSIIICITAIVTNMSRITACFTSGSCYDSCIIMSESINYCLSYKHFTANITMLTFCKTCIYTIGSFCIVDHFRVSESIYYSLSNKYFTANITMLTFCKTCVYAIGSYSTVNYFCVAKCSYYVLSYKNFTANITVFTLCKSCVCTVGSDCFVNHFRVSESVYYSLSNKYFTANITMLTFCKSCVFTIGSYCIVDYFRVSESIYYSLSNENFTADITVLTFSKSCVFTVRGNSFVNYFCMTELINNTLSNKNFVTN